MRIGVILSTTNQIVKDTHALTLAKHRKERGKFLVEGANIISNLPKDYKVIYLLIEQGTHTEFTHYPHYEVSRAVIEKVSETVNSQGIIAVVEIPNRANTIEDSGVALVLDNISDPSNVGAIIRSAAAFGFKNVYRIGGADPYSPKSVRASMGGIFFTNIITASYQEVSALKARGYSIVVADMNGENISELLCTGRSALVIGNEARGVSVELREIADKVVSIPIIQVESLNAGVAAGIIMHNMSKNFNF